MKLGQKYSHQFSYTQNEVDQFALVTGDDNPIHIDESFASNTRFKRRIMHGFLGGAIFSKVFGTLFPGHGTIYLSQTLHFKRPMYTNTNYTATFEVVEIILEKHRAKVTTAIVGDNGKEVLIGDALIQNDSVIK